MVVPFDVGRHEVTTDQPVPAIANVMQALNIEGVIWNTAAGMFTISNSGWLAYAQGGILPDPQRSLVCVVDVRTNGGFSAGKPRLLFKAQGYSAGGVIRAWDLSLDGQRFLMVKEEERKPQPVAEMILVQNWFEELKRLMPTKK